MAMVPARQPPGVAPAHPTRLPAVADRKADANRNLGCHHARDADTIVGMMRSAEYDRARLLAAWSRPEPHFLQACDTVAADFSGPIAPGMLRLREHRLFRSGFRLDEFADILAEIFSH